MSRKCVWFLHIYSCLRTTDLEIVYQKMRKWGFELYRSNSWVDCFEIKEGVDTKYKVVPISIPVSNENIEQWKLKAKNHKYYIFEYDKQCKETEKFSSNATKEGNYISDTIFLFAFPICIYYFIIKFKIFEQSVLPIWMSYLFIIAICIIYLGHFGASLTLLFQTRHFTNGKRTVKQSRGGFLLRIAISCIVNVLQIILVIIVFWGIMKC